MFLMSCFRQHLILSDACHPHQEGLGGGRETEGSEKTEGSEIRLHGRGQAKELEQEALKSAAQRKVLEWQLSRAGEGPCSPYRCADFTKGYPWNPKNTQNKDIGQQSSLTWGPLRTKSNLGGNHSTSGHSQTSCWSYAGVQEPERGKGFRILERHKQIDVRPQFSHTRASCLISL